MTKRLECELCDIYERDLDQPNPRATNPKTGRKLFRTRRQLVRHLEQNHPKAQTAIKLLWVEIKRRLI